MSEHKHSFRALFFIGDTSQTEKAGRLLKAEDIPFVYQTHAEGTASRSVLDILGLGATEKMVSISLIARNSASRLMKAISASVRIHNAGSGIIFTVPLTGTNQLPLLMMEAQRTREKSIQIRRPVTMSTHTHTLIAAIINRGYSEEVMEAARAQGAGGGTIIHCRRTGTDAPLESFGLSLQEEKEIVLIVAPEAMRLDIMQAISSACGMQTEAQGLVLSLPIEQVAGLHELE